MNGWHRRWILTVLLALVTTAVGWAQPTAPPAPEEPPAPAAEGAEGEVERSVWLISSRQLRTDEAGNPQLWVWQFSAGRWNPSSVEAFLTSDDTAVPTIISVHGNWVSSVEASTRARVSAERIARTLPESQAFRYVMFSWPSDRVSRRLRQDLQIKARRSEEHGYYLAWLLAQMDPDVPVSLVGFSYGPRLIASALELLAGGNVFGRTLAAGSYPEHIQLVFLGAAMPESWLYPDGRYGRALAAVDRLLVSRNRSDSVLRHYPRLYGRGGPAALGYTGLRSPRAMDAYAGKIYQIDARYYVGSEHDWDRYDANPILTNRLIPFLVPQNSSAAERP